MLQRERVTAMIRKIGQAFVLDTAHTIVERDANMAPTITITPGAQFSVFINADIALMEYMY